MITTLILITAILALAWALIWTLQRWRRIMKKIEKTDFDRRIFWGSFLAFILFGIATTIVYFI